ncbi:MAG: ABC transporter ATP-binding protein [Phycisphaerae bacterium]|nr:MAG: ABC transporter ATP-binding protein [Phycisphaerae bacterium]
MSDTPALEVTGLEYAYPPHDGVPGFRLTVPAIAIPRGGQALLVAPSGGGKSTTLALIAGLRTPHGGCVKVAGQDIHALRGAARDTFRGRHIGMIFQSFNLLQGFSAAENVAAALLLAGVPEREHAPRAKALLASLGLDRPGALVENLSVGQQQRVAVARALACDPVLVLADEPTASLDPANAQAAMDLIESACRARNAALLCVSHDPAMQARFERVERLELGVAA